MINKSKKSSAEPISRKEINKAMDDFFKRGGQITKITNKDIAALPCDVINYFEPNEARNFLIGD